MNPKYMHPRHPHHGWMTGKEKKNVRCPDGETRELTFQEYLDWQREWSSNRMAEAA